MREEGRRAAEEGRRRGLRGRLRSGAAHGGRFAAQRSPLVLGTAAAALGRAAAACGGRAARQHGRLLNSRNRRMRGRFACAKRSAATAVQRRRTAKFLGSARQKCGCYGVISVEAVIKRAVGGPLGEWTAVRRMAARNPKLSVPRAPTPPPPEVSTASENQQYTGFSKIELANFGVDYGSLPDAAPSGGVLRHKRHSQDGQLENPGLIR